MVSDRGFVVYLLSLSRSDAPSLFRPQRHHIVVRCRCCRGCRLLLLLLLLPCFLIDMLMKLALDSRLLWAYVNSFLRLS